MECQFGDFIIEEIYFLSYFEYKQVVKKLISTLAINEFKK